MTFTIDDVRRYLNSAPALISPDGIVSHGVLTGEAGPVDYAIHSGWDLMIANLCDHSWGSFNIKLLRHIRSLDKSGVDITPILQEAQLEDHHWRWLDKTCHYRGDTYKWFFLIAENYPQAACLIYHPKASVAGAGDIFYVEYLATAPWNRVNAIAKRVFKGVGPTLLEFVTRYAEDKLNLSPGFSLHSLPKAAQFYEKIGMRAFPKYDKDQLQFFEWVSPAHKKGK